MIEIAFQVEAVQEMKETYRWYKERDSSIAIRFNDAVSDALERIRQHPDSHPIECKQYRWVRVRRFPYRLIYEQLQDERILILAVAHTSRNPRYWRDRI